MSTTEARVAESSAERVATEAGDSFTIARLVWAERGRLIRWSAAAFALSLVIAFLLPKQYDSTARILPPDQGSSMVSMLASVQGGAAGGMGAAAADLLGMRGPGAMYAGMLTSRTIQGAIVRRFDLQKVYRDTLVEDAVKDLNSRTFIEEDKKSGIISVRVRDKDPKRAADLAGAYVEELEGLSARVSASSSHRERMFLEERLKTVKEDLDNAARELSEFSSKNMAVDITQQGKAMMDTAGRAQGEFIAAQSELKGLEQIYSENNVRVRAAHARLNELQRQMKTLGSGNGDGDINQMLPSMRKLPLLGVKYADLYRRARIEEAVFEILTKQYELAKVQEAKESVSVRVVDYPSVPERKAVPHRLRYGLAGGCFVLFAMIAWIVAKEKWAAVPADNATRVFLEEIYGDLARGRRGLKLRRLSAKDRRQVAEAAATGEGSES